MPYQKTVTYEITRRQFSVLHKLPWSKGPEDFEELKILFDKAVKQKLPDVIRTSVRVFRTSYMGRFTIVFGKWQENIIPVCDKLEEIVKNILSDF